MSYDNKNLKRFVSDDLFIGKGSFGEVYGPCDWERRKCAIKKRWLSMEDKETQLSACYKLKSLHHKRLLKVYDISLEPPAVYMLMEYAIGGSLKAILSAFKSDLPLEILKDWGIQIAEGMAYLHENNIVHRDLKSPNIVIMEGDAASNPYNKTLKITDFDQIREHDGTKIMSVAGIWAWAAPEVLTEGKFSKASDIWSYGVVLWELLTRSVPYDGVADQLIICEALIGQLKLEIPDSCPDIIKSILKRCLSNEKSKRPPFYEILLELQRYPDQDPCAYSLQQKREKQVKYLEKTITHSKAERTCIRFLEEYIDPDFGLLDKLRANGIIDWREMDDVRSKRSVCKRNSQLLNYIFAKHQNDGLIAALQDADQTHIVNYLKANGEYSDGFGGEWPLTAKEIAILDTNHDSLVDILKRTYLLDPLHSLKVINMRQVDSISFKRTSHEKNNALLEILRRRSLRDYRQVINCLHQSKQSHIAEILEIGGGKTHVVNE